MALFSVFNLAPMALVVVVQCKLFQFWIICVDSQLFSRQSFSSQLFPANYFPVPTSMRWETKKSSRRIKRCSVKLSLQSNQKSRNKGKWLCDGMVVVVVVIRISQECRRHRRCRCRHRCHRCRRRCHRRSFLCSIWHLSIRLRPDKKKAVGT